VLEWVLEWFRFTIGPIKPNPGRCSNMGFEIYDGNYGLYMVAIGYRRSN